MVRKASRHMNRARVETVIESSLAQQIARSGNATSLIQRYCQIISGNDTRLAKRAAEHSPMYVQFTQGLDESALLNRKFTML